MGTILKFIRKNGYLPATIIIFIFAILSQISIKSMTKISQMLLDNLELGNDISTLFILYIGTWSFFILAVYIRRKVSTKSILNITKKILQSHHKHILNLPQQTLIDIDQSRILSSLKGIGPIVTFTLTSQYTITKMVIEPIIIIVILGITDINLTIILCIIIIPLGLLLMYGSKLIIKTSKTTKELSTEELKILNRVKNFTLIKSFAKEIFENNKYTDVLSRWVTEKYKQKNMSVHLTIFAITIEMIIDASIFVYGVMMIPKGQISITEVLLFGSISSQLLVPFENIGEFLESVSEIIVSIDLYNEIENLEEDTDGNIDIVSFDNSIQIEGLSFSYKDSETVLDNIHLTINKGETVGIYGSSGSGKSSLVNLINRTNRPTSGVIKIDNIDITRLTRKSLCKTIGIVSQNVELFNGTIKENISYGTNATETEIIEAARKANCHKFISKLKDGYESIIGDNGIKLSGGEAQRLTLARLFLLDPPIIILDEATSKLDNESEKIVQEAIDRLSDDRTVIAIAHRLSTIKDFDTLIGIDGHRVVEQGRYESLMKDQKSLWYKLNNK